MGLNRATTVFAACAWLAVALPKLLWPAPFDVAGVEFPASLNALFGLAELVGAACLLLARTRILAASAMSVAILVGLALGILAPPEARCGCLGRINLERHERVLLSGVLLALTSLVVIVPSRSTPNNA